MCLVWHKIQCWSLSVSSTRAAQYQTGEKLEAVWARVFNFKLNSFVSKKYNGMACIQPPLKLKTRVRFRPVSQRSWSLSMYPLSSNSAARANRPTQVEPLKRLLSLNPCMLIRDQGGIYLVTNTLAHYGTDLIAFVKLSTRFKISPGPKVVKLFMSVTYECSQ